MAVIPGVTQATVQRLLERHVERDTVRAVVTDLSEPHRQAIEMALPQATVVRFARASRGCFAPASPVTEPSGGE